jgi:hypothetical protein
VIAPVDVVPEEKILILREFSTCLSVPVTDGDKFTEIVKLPMNVADYVDGALKFHHVAFLDQYLNEFVCELAE